MRRTALIVACVVSAGLGATACVDSSDGGVYDWAQREQWELPNNLREISGLALTPDGRLLAHDDERAIIYQLDYADGAVVKRFALGDPPVEDDFEGIAATATHLYLVSSKGRVLEARAGGDGESVPYQSFELGVADTCEVEGATWVKSRNALAFVCKRLIGGPRRRTRILFWSLETRAPLEPLEVNTRPAAKFLDTRRLRPSGIAWDEIHQRFVVVAAEERALVEIDTTGQIVYVARLPLLAHRQAEAIALDADGQLLLGDEGGRGKAKLSIYQPRKKK